MKLKIDKSFEKDTDKLNNKKLSQKIALCIEQVIATDSIANIPNIKKLSGFKNHYRIRIGDYRIGILFKDNEFIFERFLHRKDIYKYYP
ncbi:MAG: type II toxin-antitoxin system RelE/ParE family toxin [Bacteroidota bacterium]|nr:type II toxin-antitoxin system RelE/ParE family toxin [Bacteroidota bacterium]